MHVAMQRRLCHACARTGPVRQLLTRRRAQRQRNGSALARVVQPEAAKRVALDACHRKRLLFLAVVGGGGLHSTTTLAVGGLHSTTTLAVGDDGEFQWQRALLARALVPQLDGVVEERVLPIGTLSRRENPAAAAAVSTTIISAGAASPIAGGGGGAAAVLLHHHTQATPLAKANWHDEELHHWLLGLVHLPALPANA